MVQWSLPTVFFIQEQSAQDSKNSGISRRSDEPGRCGQVTTVYPEKSWQAMAEGLAGSRSWSQESGARCVPGSRNRAKAVSLAWAILGAWDLGDEWGSVGGSISGLCSKQTLDRKRKEWFAGRTGWAGGQPGLEPMVRDTP